MTRAVASRFTPSDASSPALHVGGFACRHREVLSPSEWIPWQYADNLISELLLFFALNVLGYAFVIFLLLRIFFPDRSSELPPLTGKK